MLLSLEPDHGIRRAAHRDAADPVVPVRAIDYSATPAATSASVQ